MYNHDACLLEKTKCHTNRVTINNSQFQLMEIFYSTALKHRKKDYLMMSETL